MKQIEIYKTYTLVLIPLPPKADPLDDGLAEEIFSQIIRHKHASVIESFRAARRTITALLVVVVVLCCALLFLAQSGPK